MATPPTTRTAVQLYRDCLRLVRHVAPGKSAKGVALRTAVRTEFCKPCGDDMELEDRKGAAVRALSNYLLTVSAPKDQKVKSAVQDYHKRSIPDRSK